MSHVARLVPPLPEEVRAPLLIPLESRSQVAFDVLDFDIYAALPLFVTTRVKRLVGAFDVTRQSLHLSDRLIQRRAGDKNSEIVRRPLDCRSFLPSFNRGPELFDHGSRPAQHRKTVVCQILPYGPDAFDILL